MRFTHQYDIDSVACNTIKFNVCPQCIIIFYSASNKDNCYQLECTVSPHFLTVPHPFITYFIILYTHIYDA